MDTMSRLIINGIILLFFTYASVAVFKLFRSSKEKKEKRKSFFLFLTFLFLAVSLLTTEVYDFYFFSAEQELNADLVNISENAGTNLSDTDKALVGYAQQERIREFNAEMSQFGDQFIIVKEIVMLLASFFAMVFAYYIFKAGFKGSNDKPKDEGKTIVVNNSVVVEKDSKSSGKSTEEKKPDAKKSASKAKSTKKKPASKKKVDKKSK